MKSSTVDTASVTRHSATDASRRHCSSDPLPSRRLPSQGGVRDFATVMSAPARDRRPPGTEAAVFDQSRKGDARPFRGREGDETYE